MPIVNGPYRAPEDDDPPRRQKVPKELAKMRREFTYERKLTVFNEVFGRVPTSDDELESLRKSTSSSCTIPATTNRKFVRSHYKLKHA